jgi:hemin uptake protein HemP
MCAASPASRVAGYPEVPIARGDAVCRLRLTSLGKLILTK